jgi:Spy/CpxP family protein refolding chaperone
MRRACVSVFVLGLTGLLTIAGSATSASAQSRPNQDQPQQRDRGNNDRPRGGFGGGGGMFGGGRNTFEASITSRSLEDYSKLLSLSDDQKSAAKALLEGYQQSFATMAGEARDKMQEMRDAMRAEMADNGPNPESFRKIGAEFDKFRKSREELDQGFFNDLKAVLTPQQADKWPAVERMHRREQSVPRGVLSGERVDLIRIVEDLKLSDDAMKPVSPILDEYSAELDRELATRNTAYDAAQTKMREMFQAGPGGGGAPDADAEKVFNDGRTAGMRVRDVNRRFARQVEGVLPEPSRPAFDEAVKKASFPLVYRDTYGSRALAAATEISGLDESQKTTIQTIKESYSRDLTAINKELEAASEKRESSMKVQDFMGGRFGGRGGGGGGGFMSDPDIAKLTERRNDLQDATLDKLKNVLTPEQFDALPKRGQQADEQQAGAGQGNDTQTDRPRRRRDNAPRQDRPTAPRAPAPGPTR